MLGAVDDAVAAVAGEYAVPRASTIGAVIDAIVAHLIGIDDAIAAMDATIHVTQAPVAAVVSAVVALLAWVDDSIATSGKRNPADAARHARPRLTRVSAVVAFLAELPVYRLVSAVRSGLALIGALPNAIRKGTIQGTLVAGFGWILQNSVTAVASQDATWHASAVASVVLAVVTLLRTLSKPVAAVGSERAIGVAAVIAAHVLGGSAIALFTRVDHGVSTFERTGGCAKACGCSIARAIVALF